MTVKKFVRILFHIDNFFNTKIINPFLAIDAKMHYFEKSFFQYFLNLAID